MSQTWYVLWCGHPIAINPFRSKAAAEQWLAEEKEEARKNRRDTYGSYKVVSHTALYKYRIQAERDRKKLKLEVNLTDYTLLIDFMQCLLRTRHTGIPRHLKNKGDNSPEFTAWLQKNMREFGRWWNVFDALMARHRPRLTRIVKEAKNKSSHWLLRKIGEAWSGIPAAREKKGLPT